MASSSSSAPQPLGNPPGEKLTRANYLLWKTQVTLALRGARLFGMVTGKETAPPETLTVEKDSKETTTPNPTYDA